MNRIICDYKGEEGPLLIVFGAMHGNEPAGVKALKMVQKMLDVEPITNPEFHFKGRLVGLIGNLKAYQQNQRYIDRDLNRCWIPELIESTDNNFYEQHELRENLACIHNLIEEYQPTEVIMLDLHTTSSFGGIFSIVTNDQQSINIAKAFHAPVITGFMEILKGTTLHYFSEDTLHLPTVALTFESGQHEEKLSINRAIAGIVNCLKVIGMVEEKHVENIHDKILIDYSNDLPKVVHLIECHSIESDDQFVMKDGYVNFQKVHKGEHLADDKHGPIHAKEDALILMPLYQKQGEDGFFLVQETS
jgi:succinylglutamate desuccinylase